MPLYTLHDLLLQHGRPGNTTALVDGEQEVTYDELAALSRQMGAVLHRAGVGRGDRVCILLRRSVRAVAAFFGTQHVGAVAVPMHDKLRDCFGINKLFFTILDEGRVLVSNYIRDLVDRGVDLDHIDSVPSGHFTVIDPQRRESTTTRYHRVRPAPAATPPLSALAAEIRTQLELWFARLAARFEERDAFVCLSGGLDSSLIAALAAKHFSRASVYRVASSTPPTRMAR